MNWELTLTGWGFLIMGGLGVIGIILVLLFDRPRATKEPPAEENGRSRRS